MGVYTHIYIQIYIYSELVLPMYNGHPYFSLKNLGKKCAFYTAKYGIELAKRSICFFSHEIKDTFFIFTNNFIDLDILSMLAI